MNAGDQQWVTTLVFVPLTAFLIYRRVKKNLGAQLVKPRAMLARCAVLTVVGIVLVATAPTADMLSAAFAGVSLGAAVAWFGIRLTRFERTANGAYYTPNTWVGLGMISLFLGRLASRLLALGGAGAATGTTATAMPRSPLTAGVFGVLLGYYIVTTWLVLRRVKHLPAPAA